jgi:hypothetical protein
MPILAFFPYKSCNFHRFYLFLPNFLPIGILQKKICVETLWTLKNAFLTEKVEKSPTNIFDHPFVWDLLTVMWEESLSD